MTLLIFLIDAVGFNHLKQSLNQMPHFSKLSKEGKFAKMETLLGYSSCILPSIWSGLSPQRTGVWCEYFLQPRKPHSLSSFLRKIPGNCLRRWTAGASFKVLQKLHIELGYHFNIPPHVEHMFSKWHIKSNEFPSIQIRGIPMLTDYLRQNKVRYFYWFTERSFREDQAMKFFSSLPRKVGPSDVIVFYIANIDLQAHVSGVYSEAVGKELKALDKFVENSMKDINQRADNLEVLLFSDHGMADIYHRFDIIRMLNRQNIKQPRDYIAFYDSTLARFWFPNKNIKKKVEEVLEECEAGRILSGADLQYYHIDFEDKKYGELIFLINEGVEIFPSYMHFIRPGYVKAMHGYDPDLSSSASFIIYHGEIFDKIKRRISVLDVCPSIIQLLNINAKDCIFEGSSIFYD